VSQVLGAFGLLDFTMLRPVLAWRNFEICEPFISLIFKLFFSGRGKSRITETADTESVDTGARPYLCSDIYFFIMKDLRILRF
jgi:hypothetical protein